jgi:very-short-patch-repair endonuclease
MPKKKNIEQIENQLKQWGLYLIDKTQYKNTHTKVDMIDIDGYKYYVSYDNMLYNYKHHCQSDIVGKINPYSMENLQIYIKKHGSNTQIIDKQYVNQKHLIHLICGKCGKHYTDTCGHIMTKSHIYCQQCGIQRRANDRRTDAEEVQKILNKYDMQLLNSNFQTTQHIEVMDKEGYKSSCANLYNIQQGQGFVRNHKHNLYTAYNIDLYLQKHNFMTRVADLTPRHIEVKYDKIGFICSNCGEVFDSTFDNIKYGHNTLCTKCHKQMSNLEYKVKTYLEEHNIKFVTQKRFEQCKYKRALPFDFYLIDYNCVIEVQGEQHYYNHPWFTQNLKERQFYDNIKKDFCIKHNIKYLALPFWLINNKPQTYKNKINEIIAN